MKSPKNGNKYVRCSVYSKCIQSDNLKRNASTHKDIPSQQLGSQIGKSWKCDPNWVIWVTYFQNGSHCDLKMDHITHTHTQSTSLIIEM